MEKKLKTNVRLIRAEDAIWMFVARSCPDYLDREWTDVIIGMDGFSMVAVFGFDKDLNPVKHRLASDWKSVAEDLGMKKCEYVLDPDGIKNVLLYDEENEKDNTKGTTK